MIYAYTHARGAASSENAILRFDLLSTPRAHYRLFVQSTRTIKINIFRERVGTQVFPHSDFREGGGGLCHDPPPLLSLLFDARELRAMPAVPYIISCSTEGRRAPASALSVRSTTQGRIAPEFPAVACCRVSLCVCLKHNPGIGLSFLLRVPPSVAALLSLSGLHRRPSVKT